MTIPFEPYLFHIPLNVQVIAECLAFSLGFRYHVLLRKYSIIDVSGNFKTYIVLGGVIGTFIGARLMGFLENPYAIHHFRQVLIQFNARSLAGGIFGAMLGVQAVKSITKERHLSMDLYTFPLILGIIIGRVGCFLNGTKNWTYGKVTDFFMAMDLGDGLYRHPIALYEILFLALLFIVLHKNRYILRFLPGMTFSIFMLTYFSFRFCIEFIKPNVFFVYGLSCLQWLCIACWIYYAPQFLRGWRLVRRKVVMLDLHA